MDLVSWITCAQTFHILYTTYHRVTICNKLCFNTFLRDHLLVVLQVINIKVITITPDTQTVVFIIV